MVAGQGLREDNSIPFENLTSQFTGMSMSYSNYKFECEFPLSVVGDNVESVEYSFENADVAIIHNGTSPDNITGEKIDLECKEAELRVPRAVYETYSAFANTYGGTILLGIRERKKKSSRKKREVSPEQLE